MNNPLKYSNCWEDATLLGNALKIDANAHVLSIASAGDNSLYLLKNQPASLTCVDLNEIQLYVTALKAAAIQHLDYNTFLGFLGFKHFEEREKVYLQLKPFLTQQVADYFDANKESLIKGIIHEGKFEKYFQKFANYVLPLIHNKKEISDLFKEKSASEQLEFYEKVWNNRRWKFLFKLFFGKWTMGKLGREPEKLEHVEANVGEYIYQKAQAHLCNVQCQHNYILHYALTGSFGNELPPYAIEENFNCIKTWLKLNTIVYQKNTLIECLQKPDAPKYNKFNLSNIFEYMPVTMFNENFEAIYQSCDKDSYIAFWNLMVPRVLNNSNKFETQLQTDLDKGFFYSAFICAKRL